MRLYFFGTSRSLGVPLYQDKGKCKNCHQRKDCFVTGSINGAKSIYTASYNDIAGWIIRFSKQRNSGFL